MRKPAFYALVAGIVAFPLLLGGVALTRPSVRSAIQQFLHPSVAAMPAKADGGLSVLPQQQEVAGSESIELHAILQGVSQDGGAVPPAAKGGLQGPRKIAFFEGMSPGDVKKNPLGLKRSDLASRDDKSIDAAIATLTQNDAARKMLVERMQRSGRYRGRIGEVLRAWKIPESMMVLGYTEGGFLPSDTAGNAVGIWHMTPDVAAGYGMAILDKYDERRGISLSTEGTAHYLADLHDRFGSWELTLYAYAVGYRAALSDINAHKVTDFWTSFDVLSREGTDYVARVLATATVLANPGRFQLEHVKLDDPEMVSDLEVPGGAPFSAIAHAASTSVARLRDLNPEYLSDVVPSTKFAMIVHVPTEGLASAREQLMPLLYETGHGLGAGNANFDWGHHGLPGADAGASDGSAPAPPPASQGVAVGSGESRRIFYKVRDGDTLESLSRTYGVSADVIVADNVLDPTAPLRAGTLLNIRAAEDASAPPPVSAPPSRPSHHHH